MLNQIRPNHRLIFSVGIVILISSLWLFLLFLVYQSYSEHFHRNRVYAEIDENIRSRAEIGDMREKVLQAMIDAGAWYSIKCEEIENDVIYDNFYFGPKDKDQVFAFWTSSSYRDGQYVVKYIGDYSDSITVDQIPEKCLPPELK